MRRTVCLLAALLVLASLGSDSPKEYDEAVVWDDGLQGSWQMIQIQETGFSWKMDHGPVTTYRNGKESIADNGRVGVYSYQVDIASRPARLDSVKTDEENKVTTWRYIYRIEGNTLRVACAEQGDQRPSSFDEKKIRIYTYKRVN